MNVATAARVLLVTALAASSGATLASVLSRWKVAPLDFNPDEKGIGMRFKRRIPYVARTVAAGCLGVAVFSSEIAVAQASTEQLPFYFRIDNDTGHRVELMNYAGEVPDCCVVDLPAVGSVIEPGAHQTFYFTDSRGRADVSILQPVYALADDAAFTATLVYEDWNSYSAQCETSRQPTVTFVCTPAVPTMTTFVTLKEGGTAEPLAEAAAQARRLGRK